jgi:DNA-binding response OmpR family regulator
MLWYDEDQMDRIISNLLSNAIKYSGTGSKVEIALLAGEDSIDLVVRDDGPGIPENQREKIFERYFQGESSSEHVWPGTGIGLALVRELVDLHHGNIELETGTSGASFRLHLLRGTHHFDQEDLNRDGVTPATNIPEESESPAELVNSPNGEDVTTILIVDDNAELRHFLGLRLASRYRVLEAGNGREGVEMAINKLPDLVISDVMMPEMNGIELARVLSENPDTATIPLILLTAKSTKRDTVEGLQAGADDYLTKPFDTSELIARVAGLIASRKLVRVSALAEFQADGSKPETNKFVSRLDQVILEHLNDSSLSVNRLAELLSMDRTSLYRKCQSNCQVSPVVYLRKQRMQVAGRLLKETEMSVSEVAYATGFESISYFSRIFRGEYKTTPSAYSNAA